MTKITIYMFILFFLISCTNQTIYSGKILNQENFTNINFDNRDNLIKKMGNPSYIDPINKKYYYFSEKVTKKSVFDKRTDYSFVFVFELDDKNKITSSKVFDLKDNNSIKLIDEQTENVIIKRGIIEKMFGGVGPQNELSNSP